MGAQWQGTENSSHVTLQVDPAAKSPQMTTALANILTVSS